MEKRKKLGLIFTYEEKWIGGTYYILNIIRALNSLAESKKPEITILSTKQEDFSYVQSVTGYPHLKFLQLRRRRKIDRLLKIYKKLKYVYKPQVIDEDFDMVFPNPEEHYLIANTDCKCYWIADFQEEHLPELFPVDDIVARKQYQIKIAVAAKRVILSSYDALKDYNRLYPFAKDNWVVLQFAVSNNSYSPIELSLLQEKYSMGTDFFFCANQFWAHKNHMLLLEAVHKLKASGITIHVLLSGKDHDYRKTGLVDRLKKYVRDNDLSDQVKFLGFIERNDMLNLMHYSQAVIQPSLFEGWSTVNEDAKSLGKYIIASDLDVNREQLQNNASFFKRDDSDSLVTAITDFLQQPPPMVATDYEENIRGFAEKFYNVI